MHGFPSNNTAYNQLLPTFQNEKNVLYNFFFSGFFPNTNNGQKQIHKKSSIGNWLGQLRNANNVVTLNIVVEIPQSLDSIIIPLQLPSPEIWDTAAVTPTLLTYV